MPEILTTIQELGIIIRTQAIIIIGLTTCLIISIAIGAYFCDKADKLNKKVKELENKLKGGI